ncbi:MAG: DUF4252 domain-containing protein [Bacteroidales bacterium]|nr:DUF4252 domain-containing protein [Bacteroidales bacterium]
MKRILAVIIVIAISTSTILAQETLRDVVKDYQNRNSEFTLVIPSFLLKMGLAFGDVDADEREVLEHIDDMKIVICEKGFNKSDFTMLENGIKNGNFEELMTVNDGGDKVRMIINQKSKRKSEMLMLVEDGSENVLLLFDFHGEPDFAKFMSLAD